MTKDYTSASEKILIDGEHLTLEQVRAVAREMVPTELHAAGRSRLHQSREIVEGIIEQERVVYGVTTGFGCFSDVLISRKDSDTLQKNIIMSHACGVGAPLPREVVRAMMLLRANSLAKGYSGVRIALVELS